MIPLTLFAGVVLFVVALYFFFKIIKDLALGIIAIFVLLLAYTFIFGSSPEVCTAPIIGNIISPICNLSSNPPDIIVAVKKVFYSVDIIATSRDNQNYLLVVVSNTGKLDESGFQVSIDNQTANITNKPKQPLKSGETTVIHTDFKSSCSSILIKTNQTASKPFNC